MAVNLNDVINESKIPDPIKLIPDYDGDTKTLHHWLQTVENVLQLYLEVQAGNVVIYNVWIGVIRSKIRGKANEALVSRNVGIVWADIRTTLIDYFGDRRDLSTLCQKIPYLRQGSNTVEDFYKEVTELTSNINQKIVLDARYAGHENAVMIFVREITKNAFIDGLRDPYNLTVRGFRPQSLEEAKSAADEQIQSVLRNKMFKASTSQASQPRVNRQNFQNSNNVRQYSNQSQNIRPNSYQGSNIRSNSDQSLQNKGQFQNRGQNFNTTQSRSNFPQSYANHNQNFNARQNSRPEPMDAETIRTRQSAQPMSTSQRTRHNQIANIDQDFEEIINQELSDENCNDTDELNDESNFQMAMFNEQTG